MDQFVNAALAILLGVGGMLVYFYGTNFVLDTTLADRFAADGKLIHSNARSRERIRPWLFVGPAMLLLTFYLLYPAADTFRRSFYDARSENFVGLDNYEWAINSSGFQQSVQNNVLWLLVVPFASTGLGLLIAVLADRVRWEAAAKALIFMPMAISFVGAAIIWRFMYAYRAPGETQIGVMNAILVWFGGQPQTWITEPPLNNFMLMLILVWIQTGFAMVLLSAALKGVPEETIEAARIDGANEIQIFFRIMIPQIAGTLAVVMTTIVIVTLKVFDIVLVMTDGQYDTEVLGNYMYRWIFRNLDYGKASVIALSIMVATLPFMFWNVYRFRREEKLR
ncbi:MAG: sugar ABC transporter permease [Anaerolineae bacterium]|nr:sugar ABC transporter permease [Anaerolineae bacterium]